MVVDEKVINEKVESGKTAELNKEEVEAVLRGEGPVEGYQKPEDLSTIPGKVVDKPVEGEKLEEAKKEETKKEEPAKKAEETPAGDDVLLRVETELAKSEGQVDLSKLSKSEQALYWQMKRDRKARQKAEEERDAALFRETQAKKTEVKPVVEEDPIEAALKGRDPTDFLTVKEVTDLLKKVVAVKNTEDAKPAVEKKPAIDPLRMKMLTMFDNEARTAHSEDYDAVMELAGEILDVNAEYLDQVAEALANGENPAIKSYELIKGDPEFAKLFPIAETRIKARKAAKEPVKKDEAKKEEVKPAQTAEEVEKGKKAREAQERLEANQNKTKTTGHVDTAGDKGDNDLALEEIAKMTDREFARLPKKTREKYLNAMREV